MNRPVFTIAIGDKHVDEKDTLTWTCEAFGIPDVKYKWLKDSKVLESDPNKLAIEDRGRYEIQDNVLIIRDVSTVLLCYRTSPLPPKKVRKKAKYRDSVTK